MILTRSALDAAVKAALYSNPLANRHAGALASGCAAIALSLGFATVAHGQEKPAASSAATASASASAPVALEEVTVTGSRIRRRDMQSSSPLVTVDSSQLESQSGLNIESYLNQLPNFNPAAAPTVGTGPGSNSDVQATAVNTVGISTISLRGLGPNRSLVLVDGHRTTPVNALMVTDINSIPAIMIDRVEIISGGASAVYGADAIGGVTNFILKHNFQGLELDVQDGVTQVGDGNELRASALMGTKISDGRGNIMAGMEFYDRHAAWQRNRDFYKNGWADPNVGGQDFFVMGYNGYNTVFSPPGNAALSAIFPGRVGTGPVPHVFGYPGSGIISGLRFNSDGTLFDLAGPLSTSGFKGPTTGGGYALQNIYDTTYQNSAATPPPEVQTLKWNNPQQLASEPQTRYSFFANGTFDITDKVQFYSNARFSESKTQTILFPANASFGWETSVPYNAQTDSPINPTLNYNDPATLAAIVAAKGGGAFANPNFIGTGQPGAQHPVPWQLAMLLNSRARPPGPIACNPVISPRESINCPGGPSAPSSWVSETYPLNSVASRSTTDTTTEWTIETGVRFPIIADWTGDVYYSRGQSTAYNLAYGDNSLQRQRALIQAPDYGRGASLQGNQNGASTGFGTSVPSTCTSGYYNTFFGGDAALSTNCQQAVMGLLQTQTQIQQDIVESDFQGSLFKLPAGDVSGAIGYQYRRDAGQFYPDGLQSTNSFLDQVIGVYPTAALDAETSVRDYYAEMFIPVLADLGPVKSFNLDVGGRYSDYDKTSSTTTFKITGDLQVTRSFRFRGGYQRASRAPNLGELFLNEQEYFGGGAVFGDPCSVRSRAPFGAGGADVDRSSTAGAGPTQLAGGQTAAGAMSTYLICQAQMGGGSLSDPNSAVHQYYYNTFPAGQGGAANASAFAWLNEEGNSKLRSETADTWTGGIVFSNLGDSPWISGLTTSVDWWELNIHNAIELDSPDYAGYLCYGTVTVTNATEAAAQAATPACQNVGRNQASGGETTALLQYTNAATIATSGVDLQVNWFAQFADLGLGFIPGGLSFNTQDTWLNYYRTKTSPAVFDVTTDWKNSLGPTLAGTNPGAYGYRLFTNFGYVLPSFSFNVRWRFYPSVNSPAHATQQAIVANNNAVAGGAGGTILSYTPNTDLAAPHYNAIDLSFNWNINSVLQLRGGIDNVFDANPAIIGGTNGRNAGYPVGTNLNAVCSAAAAQKGCVNPTAYVIPDSGAGVTNGGFYDVLGRRFWVGIKARF